MRFKMASFMTTMSWMTPDTRPFWRATEPCPNGSKQFLIHNSWGARWGENGYGCILGANGSKKYTRRLPGSCGGSDPGIEAVPSPAAPSPSPAANCPAGQIQEPVFGTCIPSSIPGLPSAPSPTPPKPSPGMCPQGQAADLMTGQCMALCPNGGAAVGGVCVPFAR